MNLSVAILMSTDSPWASAVPGKKVGYIWYDLMKKVGCKEVQQIKESCVVVCWFASSHLIVLYFEMTKCCTILLFPEYFCAPCLVIDLANNHPSFSHLQLDDLLLILIPSVCSV